MVCRGGKGQSPHVKFFSLPFVNDAVMEIKNRLFLFHGFKNLKMFYAIQTGKGFKTGVSQAAITYSKLTIETLETLEQSVKYIQS